MDSHAFENSDFLVQFGRSGRHLKEKPGLFVCIKRKSGGGNCQGKQSASSDHVAYPKSMDLESVKARESAVEAVHVEARGQGPHRASLLCSPTALAVGRFCRFHAVRHAQAKPDAGIRASDDRLQNGFGGIVLERGDGVADVFPFYHEDHHFRNVGGMVCNPFKALGDVVDLDGSGDGFRVFHHEG